MNKMPQKNARPSEPKYWQVIGDNFPDVQESKSASAVETDERSDCVSKIKLKLQDVQDAHQRIRNEVVFTPIVEAKHVGKKFCKVFLKCENFQNTGSFKARGACNMLHNMSPSDKSKGCTISGGRNFVSAMTYYGHKQSVPMNVVVPKDCPLADKQTFKENYAIVKVYGNDANEANLHALSYNDEIGTKYIHWSDRLDLIAGYGTMGLEVLTQMEKLDAIICPVGSGCLVSSLVLAVKTLKPNCLIYGVECAAAPVMSKALQEKKPVLISLNATMADSLAQVIASTNAFHIIRGYLDKMITVDETSIARAMVALLEREKMWVEAAAACGVAAIMADKVPELYGKKNPSLWIMVGTFQFATTIILLTHYFKSVVCIITGGNIDSSRMPRVIERGMAAEGRLLKLLVTMRDVPGAIARLLASITDVGADVKNVIPDRIWVKRDIFNLTINLLIETNDRNHSKELERKITKEYPSSQFIM